MGSAFWLQTEKPKGLCLKGIGFRHLLERRPRRIRDYLMGIPHARRQLRQQTAEAMDGLTVRGLMALLLCLGRLRRLSRLDRVAVVPVCEPTDPACATGGQSNNNIVIKEFLSFFITGYAGIDTKLDIIATLVNSAGTIASGGSPTPTSGVFLQTAVLIR